MNFIKRAFASMAHKEHSLQRLTLSFCIGNYVAFSPFPFPFGHTGLALLLSRLLNLNTSVVLLATFLINNPWTAIPVYSADYFFGYWLIHNLCNISGNINPTWVENLNIMLSAKFGLPHFCFWSFFIGGNLLGIATSVILYPISKYLFYSLIPTKTIIHENSSTK